MELRLAGDGFLDGLANTRGTPICSTDSKACWKKILHNQIKESGDGGIFEAILDYRMHVECMNNCYIIYIY